MTDERDFFTSLDVIPAESRRSARRREASSRRRRTRLLIVSLLAVPALAGTFVAAYKIIGSDDPVLTAAKVPQQQKKAAVEKKAAPATEAPSVKLSPAPTRTDTSGTSRRTTRTSPSTTPAAVPTPKKKTRTTTEARTTTSARTVTKTVAPPSGPGASASGDEAEVLRLVNVERDKVGCKPLTANATLAKVAEAHSKDMAVNGYFDHNSQDGTTPFQRMAKAGYKYSYAAENIAAGQPDPAAVMDAWMHSAGHKANILNCNLKELGVGVWKQSGSKYGIYWTQDFGTPL